MIERLKPVTEPFARRPRFTIGVIAAIMVALIVLAALALTNGSSSTTSTSAAVCYINCGSGPRVASPAPAVMHLLGVDIPIVPVNASPLDWKSTVEASKGEWLAGTIVNYIIGLSASPENIDRVQALLKGDPITLDLAGGQTLNFQYTGQQQVNRRNTDPFAQASAGLTLVVLSEDGNTRLVATAQYLADTAASVPPLNALGTIQSPVEIGPVRVTVQSTRYVPADPNAPNTPSYFLVDFLVESIGAEPIDASQFAIELHDYAQRTYSVSEGAGLLGSNGSVTGTLEPGGSALFTTGFEFPGNITSPLVVWGFKPNAEFPAEAKVALPILQPTPTPEPRTQVTVEVSQAYASPDQSAMIFVVGLRNPTSVAVPIEVADVSLVNADGVLAQLNQSEPALPFVLRPGMSATLTLKFSRIPGTSALLKVLMNEFQVNIG
jgi:hypothetical protein